VFDSFTQSPLCARRVFPCWRPLPSKIGGYDNASEFRRRPTLRILRAAGYQTSIRQDAFCGPDQLHGFEERLTTISIHRIRWTPDWTRFDERPAVHSMDSVLQAALFAQPDRFDDEVVTARAEAVRPGAQPRPRPFVGVHDASARSVRRAAALLGPLSDEEITPPKVSDLAGAEDPHATRCARHRADLAKPNRAGSRARRAYTARILVDDSRDARGDIAAAH